MRPIYHTFTFILRLLLILMSYIWATGLRALRILTKCSLVSYNYSSKIVKHVGCLLGKLAGFSLAFLDRFAVSFSTTGLFVLACLTLYHEFLVPEKIMIESDKQVNVAMGPLKLMLPKAENAPRSKYYELYESNDKEEEKIMIMTEVSIFNAGGVKSTSNVVGLRLVAILYDDYDLESEKKVNILGSWCFNAEAVGKLDKLSDRYFSPEPNFFPHHVEGKELSDRTYMFVPADDACTDKILDMAKSEYNAYRKEKYANHKFFGEDKYPFFVDCATANYVFGYTIDVTCDKNGSMKVDHEGRSVEWKRFQRSIFMFFYVDTLSMPPDPDIQYVERLVKDEIVNLPKKVDEYILMNPIVQSIGNSIKEVAMEAYQSARKLLVKRTSDDDLKKSCVANIHDNYMARFRPITKEKNRDQLKNSDNIQGGDIVAFDNSYELVKEIYEFKGGKALDLSKVQLTDKSAVPSSWVFMTAPCKPLRMHNNRDRR